MFWREFKHEYSETRNSPLFVCYSVLFVVETIFYPNQVVKSTCVEFSSEFADSPPAPVSFAVLHLWQAVFHGTGAPDIRPVVGAYGHAVCARFAHFRYAPGWAARHLWGWLALLPSNWLQLLFALVLRMPGGAQHKSSA